MKNFKKIISAVLATVLVASMSLLAGCGEAKETSANADKTSSTAAQTDSEYIKSKGKLVVGITEYEPMDFKDETGKWTGFDAEFATAAAKKLGVEVEFVEINWDNKWLELNAKTIDCVWNGMTITDEAKVNASCTNAYVVNAQVVIMKADKAAQYTTKESLKGLTFAVESGSAGQSAATEASLKIAEYPAQSDALMAVASSKVDGCVIDITMASAMTGEGTSYTNLKTALSLTTEDYGIACRKGSDLTDKLNTIMSDLKADGTLKTLANKYKLTLK